MGIINRDPVISINSVTNYGPFADSGREYVIETIPSYPDVLDEGAVMGVLAARVLTSQERL